VKEKWLVVLLVAFLLELAWSLAQPETYQKTLIGLPLK
jgi:hypothetical protein